jgi:hypothetical protein
VYLFLYKKEGERYEKKPDQFLDERGKLISLHAWNTALEFVIAATQLLTMYVLFARPRLPSPARRMAVD